ncbi:bifunctional [glutamine synthetase] adenylyltransferase/[glutamine synthetase]-adenylyl-L-tyrosine phosphorylase [Pseudooceanicola aestuarii]|uniref:bifunctional [glutamine synthetase] adenylyltransferase/[glutamine synthetase]-adenylyl-L-tyrosine phosphorylase n=1 Tax=Pseudooceanicola aestuarii TaxID=2697319 RepID=UPI0013D45BDA|nr:bifunctional [glutamine synthetase] adenylyltransferase/[glutamine synthetase]-adenylyl-L-tyrosine phosphorylase [Pseudooceanicola aestuarii]
MSTILTPTRMPRPFDSDRGGEARALFPDLPAPLADLMQGAGGCSPYLLGLMAKERDWVVQAVQDPQAAFDAELSRIAALAADQAASGLRQGKRRMALLIALADLSGHWRLEEVTGHLSRFADAACQLALRTALSAEIRRGKIPGATEDDLETGAGLVLMAMGKMGAGELNFSSDIDLIALFDETRFDPDDFLEARPAFIRATRKLAGLMNDITGDGYVFRTDLRLRPDPSVTPVCVGMEAAERYYESLGRTWERAAYIKARPCAGDVAGGRTFLEALRPFIWRRHLDFAAIQDAHAVRLAIRDSKGLHGAITLPGHDMKLGRGGIREIEFFTQFHQLIAGGRDPALRLRGTVDSLAMLAERGWIPAETAEELTGHYRAHREVEHRVQMVHDSQTHDLPQTDDGFARLAAMMDRDTADLRRELSDRLEAVHAVTEEFFAPGGPGGAAPEVGTTPDAPDIAFDAELVARWRSYPALSSDRARQIFDRLRPHLLSALSRAAHPDEALMAFDGFLAGLPAGVQLFSLFEANPQLIALLGDIVGTAPDLARYLSRNASVFDAVIAGDFFADWPGEAALVEALSATLRREADYEARLDTARRWVKDWHFRIGVHHLRGLITAREAGRQYADLADAVLRVLWPVVQDNFATRHGPAPGRGAVVVGMGSLGAQRLNARSDLDLIVIYDADGVEASEGRKPLAARTYYARLTQALVTALSAPMAEGRLYEVDMRLRPSGNQGPVATSWAAFRDYQRNQAWTWEHLALTRARVITGPPGLSGDVAAFRCEILSQDRAPASVLRQVAEMRARIARARGGTGRWDVKTGPGRNQEIELLAQAGLLIAGHPDGGISEGLERLADGGWLTAEEATSLKETYRLLWQVGQVGKLLTPGALDPDAIGEGGRALLLRETGMEEVTALEALLQDRTTEAEQAMTAGLARGQETDDEG